jgi:hypothetical protein
MRSRRKPKRLALEYKRATKKNKGRILDSLVRLAEYNRSYAARVLRHGVTASVLARGTVAGAKARRDWPYARALSPKMGGTPVHLGLAAPRCAGLYAR